MFKRRMKKHTAGFTLAELLIVVAILLVLIAIAVPLFAGALGNAEEATCEANRRSLKSTFLAAYTLGDDKNSSTVFEKCLADLKAENNGIACPTDGSYSIKSDDGEGHIVVRCSKHGLRVDEGILAWIQETYNGAWHQFVDEDGKQITSDIGIRRQYALQHGLTEWPKVTGIGKDGAEGALYIEFKSFGNTSNSSFLYAGTNKDPNATDWNAYYVCDSAGLLGSDSKGQWYRITSNPKGENIAKDEAGMKAILEKNKANKVDLVNDKFVDM
ncbi:competence type IV pilus major pilin ComGC [Raoultibacter massiliensis]|uniref:Type II secretion system protein n=1 Tax=Raoultibacter massiliensis TaxID=1852371 RepID=A0ABV1JEP8_9ACTN